MTCRHLQRLARKHVARPRSRQPRHHHRINPVPLINSLFCEHDFRVRGGARRIVAARHVYFDVAEPLFSKMRLQQFERFLRCHVRHQTQIQLRHRASWQNRFPSRTRVPSNQPFDIHGRFRHQQLQRLLPTYIVDPTLNAHSLFGGIFVQPFCRDRDHLLLCRAQRPGLRGVSFDRGFVSVGCHKRR